MKLILQATEEEKEQIPIEGGLIEESEEDQSLPPEMPDEAPITAASGPSEVESSDKSRLAVTLFALLLGSLGAHRFYLERVNTAVIALALGVLGWISLVTMLLTGISESTDVWMGVGTMALVFVVIVAILIISAWATCSTSTRLNT